MEAEAGGGGGSNREKSLRRGTVSCLCLSIKIKKKFFLTYFLLLGEKMFSSVLTLLHGLCLRLAL